MSPKISTRYMDGCTQNQIDHLFINSRWRDGLHDVLARRGTDIGSDHVLIIAKLTLKLRRAARKAQRALQVDVGKL